MLALSIWAGQFISIKLSTFTLLYKYQPKNRGGKEIDVILNLEGKRTYGKRQALTTICVLLEVKEKLNRMPQKRLVEIKMVQENESEAESSSGMFGPRKKKSLVIVSEGINKWKRAATVKHRMRKNC